MNEIISSEPHRSRGRLFLLLGLGLAALGAVAYAVQISLGRLMAPWYMPALASLGVVLVVLSLIDRRTIWRTLALCAVVLLASAEWAMMLGLRLPPYTGPIEVGRPFPAFETLRADGTPFTQRDLGGDRSKRAGLLPRSMVTCCTIELVQLERRHDDFGKRNARVLVASLEGFDDAKKTQTQFPHLIVLADEGRNDCPKRPG